MILGVKIDKDFEPVYVVIPRRRRSYGIEEICE
jgi:hypothetical protein